MKMAIKFAIKNNYNNFHSHSYSNYVFSCRISLLKGEIPIESLSEIGAEQPEHCMWCPAGCAGG